MPSNSGNPNLPEIAIQIVHIEGPRRGEIDELRKSTITVGRDPSADIFFPKELRIVSRRHAEIKREGNRFLLINHGVNGTLVNGRPADNVYLKPGDVITFAEGGPKVSFLYDVSAPSRPSPGPVVPSALTPPQQPPSPPPTRPRSSPGESAPVTVQYGTSIKSFKQRVVKLGKEPSNDFVLDHARVYGSHAEVFFQQGQYYIRDMTESHATLLNDRPIQIETSLQNDDVITFGDGGPRLKYLGTGRFAELIE